MPHQSPAAVGDLVLWREASIGQHLDATFCQFVGAALMPCDQSQPWVEHLTLQPTP